MLLYKDSETKKNIWPAYLLAFFNLWLRKLVRFSGISAMDFEKQLRMDRFHKYLNCLLAHACIGHQNEEKNDLTHNQNY